MFSKFSFFARLISLGANPSNIGPAINLAVAQRLVRKICQKCGATLREKGGRTKIKNGSAGWRTNGVKFCKEDEHKWGKIVGDVELKEFPYFYKDVKAFLAAKTLWEWENDYWLRQVGYLR